MDHVDVLIVGAGPTGLVLACELRRRGIDMRIVDAAAQPARGSRGFTLKPRSLEVLAAIGAVGPVLAVGAVEQRMRFHLGSAALFDLDLAPTTDPHRPYPNPLGLPQWRVEAALRERLAELGTAVELGRGVTAIDPDPDGVTATFADGARVRARYLVGADGGRGLIRPAAGIGFPGRTDEDRRAIVADAAVEGLDRAVGTHLWVGRRGMVALRPIPHEDHWQLVVSLDPDPASSSHGAEPTLSDLRALVAARTGRADLEIAEPVWRSVWRYNLRLADRYRDGRVLLAGDAAHVHSPFGGHGMNTGIQDAANLAWKLALVIVGAAGEWLLDTYELERRPVATRILADSDRQLTAVLPPPFLRPLLRPLLRTGFARRQRATRDDHPVYRVGPLTVDRSTRRSPVRAGDPLPDAMVLLDGRGTRLHEILRRPTLTVLTFGAAALTDLGPIAPHVTIIPITATADPTGALHRAFAATPGTAVVVRPDGYVGLVAHRAGPAAAGDYLRSLSR